MSTIRFLSDFFEFSQAQWHVYDLSYQVKPMDKELFQRIEQGLQPYPSPRQGKAWLAFVFWQPEQEPFIWFVHFPLDERNGFQDAAMRHFMNIVLETLQQNKGALDEKQQEQALKHNPYIFQPDESRLASLHAQLALVFDKQVTEFEQQAQSYLLNQEKIDWRTLQIQAIYLLMQRHHQNSEFSKHIIQHFFLYPTELQHTLMLAGEHLTFPTEVVQQSLALLATNTLDAKLLSFLRFLSSNSQHSCYQDMLAVLLKQASALSQDTQLWSDFLLLIASRAWKSLTQPELLALYLEQVARYDQHHFEQIFKELVRIAELRPWCLQLLQNEQRSQPLQQAIVAMVQVVKHAQ